MKNNGHLKVTVCKGSEGMCLKNEKLQRLLSWSVDM